VPDIEKTIIFSVLDDTIFQKPAQNVKNAKGLKRELSFPQH